MIKKEFRFRVKEVARTGIEADFLIEKDGQEIYCESNYDFGFDSQENYKTNKLAKATIELDNKTRIKKIDKKTKKIKLLKGRGYCEFTGEIIELDKKQRFALIDCGTRLPISLSENETRQIKKGDFVSTEGIVWLFDLKFLENLK